MSVIRVVWGTVWRSAAFFAVLAAMVLISAILVSGCDAVFGRASGPVVGVMFGLAVIVCCAAGAVEAEKKRKRKP